MEEGWGEMAKIAEVGQTVIAADSTAVISAVVYCGDEREGFAEELLSPKTIPLQRVG